MAEEYISREAAITAMTADNLLEHFDSVEDIIENRFHRAAERILASLPAADVAEVVRCANCKHWKQRDNREYGFCAKQGGIWLNSDYCPKGERKDGGQDDV